MKRLALAVALAALAGSAVAAEKSYQVTGPVLDVTPETITVQKGKENWEIARGADTKGGAEVKKGDKVTVQYKMTATSIEVKADKKAETKGKK
jgi:opacity protein-like surface antigen